MARFKLHGIWASGPTYKVALMLALSGEPYDYVHVNLQGGEHKSPDFLSKNRFGQVPCLEDTATGVTMSQSGAILEYLAEQTGRFLPQGVAARQAAREWVFWGWDKLARGIYRSRAFKFGFAKAVADVIEHYAGDGANALKDLDAYLKGRDWLAGEVASFADIDLYGVVAYAGQAGFQLNEFPSIEAWMQRIERMPGFADVNTLLP